MYTILQAVNVGAGEHYTLTGRALRLIGRFDALYLGFWRGYRARRTINP